MARIVGVFAQLLALTALCNAYPTAESLKAHKITRRELAKSYDYIVVGGGQSGVVIATRLSEDPSKTVLVVEYGWLNDDPAQLEPPSAVNYLPKNLYNVTALPNPALTGNAATDAIVWAAAVVGGGSTVNGMMLDRAAPEDYDNWERLGNPGWSFRDLLPYFRKSTHLSVPREDIREDFNITYDLSAYGENGPVQLSYPTWQWPGVKWKGVEETGVPAQIEQGLNAYGLFWYPAALDPVTETRSYAVSGYYQPAASRSNLHLLTWNRVNEILFDDKLHATGVTIEEREAPSAESITTVNANLEIIITSGFLHTPQILQRSGIGPKELLEEAGIPVLVDAPGVGHNFQDHSATRYQWVYQNDLPINPNSLFTNQTFYDWAQELWEKNRTGPNSLTVPGNTGAWLPLTLLSDKAEDIISQLKGQNNTDYLPKTYRAESVAGYVKQLELMITSLASKTSAVIEMPFNAGGSSILSYEHPISRGSVLLNTTDKYAEPLVFYNTFANPVDSIIVAEAWKYVRKWMATPSMQPLSPIEAIPGPDLVSDEDLIAAARDSTSSSTAHGCRTAAMMPRELGGVVSPDLLVYGVTGLSVGDISTIPLHIATHTCATVYAIAEKAADMIKARHAEHPSWPGQ